MFHMFQTYVAEVLSCCSISRRRKRTHADVVPTGVAVSTCAASEAGVWHVNRHVAQSLPACVSTCMRCAAACVRARRAGVAVVCGTRGAGRAGTIVAGRAGVVPFLYEWSAVA
jgi:hypothetical protein